MEFMLEHFAVPEEQMARVKAKSRAMGGNSMGEGKDQYFDKGKNKGVSAPPAYRPGSILGGGVLERGRRRTEPDRSRVDGQDEVRRVTRRSRSGSRRSSHRRGLQ